MHFSLPSEACLDFVYQRLEANVTLGLSLLAPLTYKLLKRAPNLVQVDFLGHDRWVAYEFPPSSLWSREVRVRVRHSSATQKRRQQRPLGSQRAD